MATDEIPVPEYPLDYSFQLLRNVKGALHLRFEQAGFCPLFPVGISRFGWSGKWKPSSQSFELSCSLR